MALNLVDFLKQYTKGRSLVDLIPVQTFLNDQTLATKTGSAITGFGLKPIDDECLSREEKQFIVKRLIAATNLLSPSERQYQYVFKARRFSLSATDAAPDAQPSAFDVERRRHEHLRQNAVGGTVEIFHVLESILPFSAKQLARLSGDERRQQHRRLVSELDSVGRGYMTDMSDLITPRRLDKQEMFGLFHRFLHLGDDWDSAPPLASDSGIDIQLKRSSVYWDPRAECLRVGRRYVRVYTMSELPDETVPNIFGELLSVKNADLAIITTWQPMEKLDVKAELIQLRNLIVNFERRGWGDHRAIRKDPTLAEDLKNSGVSDDLAEINKILAGLRRKRHTGMFSLRVLLHSDRFEDLDAPAAEISKIFRLPSAALHEEVGNTFLGNVVPIYFSCLPGNRWGLREDKLQNDHYAELAQIWASETGEREHYANVYETRPGPLHFRSTHYNMVAAELVVGMTRSGKTVYQQDLIAALQTKNPITRIYDVGGSYETLAAHFNGSIMRCSLGEWQTQVNPFAGNINSRNFREFCVQFVSSLAETEKDYRFTLSDRQQLYKKLEGLFSLRPHLRRLQTLQRNLDGDLKIALSRWVEGGQYGALFDHAEDKLVISDFQVFEFEQAEDGVATPYMEAFLLLLIYRDIRVMLDPAQRGRLKHITFDECMSHWKRPQVADFVKRLLKTMQKRKVMTSLVTQSPEDMGMLQPFILQSCSSFAFFPNPKIADTVLTDLFGFDETRIDTFRSLRPREFLYHALRGHTADLWKVLKLTIDPYRYWMYTTSPDDVVKRDAAIERYGDPATAIQNLAAGA